MVACAEVLDQLSGIEYYLGIAVGLHLQKFWISFAAVNVVMTLAGHFGRPEGAKLALERRLEQHCAAVWRQVGPGTALYVGLGRLKRPLGGPGDAKLALEWR